MTQSKKYHYQITHDNTGWKTEIVRRVSSKKNHISKTQGGFATEAEAETWGQNEVKAFLHNLNIAEQKKRRDRKNEQAQ